MKTIVLTAPGIQHLTMITQPVPAPAPHEVLVQIKAVALNARDKFVVDGTFSFDVPFPFMATSDGAGIVAGVGKEVTSWKVGDKVTTHYFPAGNFAAAATQGQALLSEYVCVPAADLAGMPAHLGFQEACTLPICGFAAWLGLVEGAALKAGDTLLTQGTGAVSLFALQLAKAMGAKVIATTGSAAKASRLQALGADEVINYKETPGWPEQVKAFTGGAGVDATLDVAGAATLQASIQSLKPGGFLGITGTLGGYQATVDLFPVILNNIRLQGVMRLKGLGEGSNTAFNALCHFMETKQMVPVVDRTFAITEVPAAFRYFEQGDYFGKLVVLL